MIDYNGIVELWECVYGGSRDKNKDIIEELIKKIHHTELADGKLIVIEENILTAVKISKTPVYDGKEETNNYRRLVRIETTGDGEIPKNITEILENQEFTPLNLK